MAYTINLTDGTIFATVADGTVDTSSSITLIGKNVANYGELLDENYIRLLESHATLDSAPPAAPLTGQVWFDKTAGSLKVYDGAIFKTLGGGAEPSATEPTSPELGNMWFNTTTDQTYIYDGANYQLIGPISSTADGSNPIVVTVSDGTFDHIIIEEFVNGILIGITSSDPAFSPSPAITGFGVIEPGYNLSTTVANAVFNGTATNATVADTATTATTADNALSLGGQLASKYLRSDVSDIFAGTLTIANDTSLIWGANNEGKLSVSGSTVYIENVNLNSDMLFRVNDGGVMTTAITINAASGRARVSEPLNIADIATAKYVGDQIALYVPLAGGVTMSGNLSFGVNDRLLIDLGSTAAPGIAFNGDTDTGMYGVSVNSLALVTAGVRRLTVESNGVVNVIGTANYETLVTHDDDIPNKKYVDDAAATFVGVDYPSIEYQTIRTDVSSAWTTKTVNANARFAFISGIVYGSFAAGGYVRSYVRKKGLTGNALERHILGAVGPTGGTSANLTATGTGSLMVECNASGQVEYYSRHVGATSVSSGIIVKGWIE